MNTAAVIRDGRDIGFTLEEIGDAMGVQARIIGVEDFGAGWTFMGLQQPDPNSPWSFSSPMAPLSMKGTSYVEMLDYFRPKLKTSINQALKFNEEKLAESRPGVKINHEVIFGAPGASQFSCETYALDKTEIHCRFKTRIKGTTYIEQGVVH